MVSLPGGSFMMGATDGQAEAGAGDTPHQVTLSPFCISRCDITQGQYAALMGANPSYFGGEGSPGIGLVAAGVPGGLDDTYYSERQRSPVEEVSWYDACEFCNRLSVRMGRQKVYAIDGRSVSADFSADGFRLPTEAEWEYAARAGESFPFAGSTDPAAVAWFEDNSQGTTHPVGTKAANAWGLYDMSGNVWQWCWDWFNPYPAGPQTDPQGGPPAERKVIRGGSWYNPAAWCTVSRRFGFFPSYNQNDLNIGFRVVARTPLD
jgi:formylglycine-generating enzyme required for sulfatase activity